MRLGSLTLVSPLFLAPLAGYTTLPFRLVVRELGGLGLATTDLINARSLIEKNRKALLLVATRAADTPLAVQLFGAVPEEMRDAALLLEALGVAAVDLNMGCPVPKVVRNGGGSALMTDPAKAARLAQLVVQAVKIPVTAKMRLGWDDDHLTAPDLARALEDVGIAAITVHGRTRAQGFAGSVRLDGIGAVVRAVRAVPVIGNGDVTTPNAARRMLTETGCAGVSIGRGAFYDPWIFRRTEHFLRTGQLEPEAGFEERVRILQRHLDLMVEVFGESVGCRMFRKIAPWYAKRFGPARDFNRRMTALASRAQLEDILAQYRLWRRPFLDDTGELLPRYRPAEADTSALISTPWSLPSGPAAGW